ncbi:hypothetical protein D3C87_1357310 [compost metagenome]
MKPIPVSITANDNASRSGVSVFPDTRNASPPTRVNLIALSSRHSRHCASLALSPCKRSGTPGATSTLKSSDLLDALPSNCTRNASTTPRRLKVDGVALSLPACNSVRVRMPLTMRIMSRAEPAAVCWYCSSSGSISTVCISSSEPITPFIGVRNSWVRVARNSSLSWLLRASCWLRTSSFCPASSRVCACCSRMALMRSASARDSNATSMAEPIWLEYMVRNTFGR